MTAELFRLDCRLTLVYCLLLTAVLYYMSLCFTEEVVYDNVPLMHCSSLFSSLWHGTLPECYSGHNVANVEHGQTGQHEVGLLVW